MTLRWLAFSLLSLQLGCAKDSGSASPDANRASEAGPRGVDAVGSDPGGCSRGVLEADIVYQAALSGPGVDTTTGRLKEPGTTVVVSSTYIRLKPDQAAQQRFNELVRPVLTDVRTRRGLLAQQVGTSSGCNTGRTLTVWSDQAAMMEFIRGTAHATAMAAVGELSRGGGMTVSWTTQQASAAGWDEAMRRLAAKSGPGF